MRRKHIRVKLVDAFTAQPFGGSPAGVVLDADCLSEEEMLLIAREMNASVTAFILLPGEPEADFKLRFFTPQSEVDLSGHASLAAFHTLVEEGKIWGGKVKMNFHQETKAGVLPVELIFENGRLQCIYTTQALPSFRETFPDTIELAEILGIKPREIAETGLPVELAYTGMWHLIVPVRQRETFAHLKPDLYRLETLNLKLGAASTHLFCLETVDKESIVHVKGFAGVREKAVSGTANSALGCYLVKNGVVEIPTGRILLTTEQGFDNGRLAKVNINITVIKKQVTAVQIGGTAVTLLDGILRL